MLGNFEGSPEDVLDQVAAMFADSTPQATCRLSRDGCEIVCQAEPSDGVLHTELLRVDHLPAEAVRHAVMRMGKATHLSKSIGEWERWASAWHMIQNHGDDAIAHV